MWLKNVPPSLREPSCPLWLMHWDTRKNLRVRPMRPRIELQRSQLRLIPDLLNR
jgi:hypothetical protein